MHINIPSIFSIVIIIGAGCAPTATHKSLSDESVQSSEVFSQEAVAVEIDDQEMGAAGANDDQPADQIVEPATQRVYMVRKNDTLWSIAADYYGDGQRWRDILTANPGLEPTKMRVGQQLILP